LGQSFQVHGVADQIYNIISTPSFTYNALFTYLYEGKARKGTQSFSHPGNYFGAVGMVFSSGDSIKVTSGPVDSGLILTLNDEIRTVSLGSTFTVGNYNVSMIDPFQVTLESDEFNIRIQNSDMFLNQDVSISNGLMKSVLDYKAAVKTGNTKLADQLKAKLPHGILGQTWNPVTYKNRWVHIEGQLFDYTVDQLLSSKWKYSKAE